MPKKLLALGSLAAVLLTAAAAPAVTPGEDTGVMVDALVLDRAGNPVPGLNRGDFEITIGDQVRPVSGARMLSADTTPRRFVFIVNRRGALPAQLHRMKEGLKEFVSARFGERDEALFVDFAEVPRITRGWRTGPAEALPEIRNITPMGFRSSLGPAEDTADAAFMLQALAGRLADLPGRKVVVLFSASLSTFAGTPGGDLEPVAPWGWADPPSSKAGADDALAALAHGFNAANGSLYTVHLEGARRQDEGILEASRAEFVGTAYDLNGSVVGLRRARDSSASLSGRRKQAFARPTDDFLSSLASETGGAYTAQATDFARILEGIEASNRLWYELSFEPFGTNIPGRYQPHEVRVRNRPGLTVVVRPGHVIPE
jgi:VWFA-related protein